MVAGMFTNKFEIHWESSPFPAKSLIFSFQIYFAIAAKQME